MFSVGIKMNLDYVEKGEKTQYKSTIVDEDEDILFIDYPVNKETGKARFFSVGATFSVFAMIKEDDFCLFDTEVVTRKIEQVPMLGLKRPDESQIKRVQRRNYMRMEATADVAVKSIDEKFAPFTTVTVDISGGGLAIIAPKSIPIKTYAALHVYLALYQDQKNPDIQYVNATTSVVSIREWNKENNLVSMQLTDITDQDRQKIIRYNLFKEREKRMKERQ